MTKRTEYEMIGKLDSGRYGISRIEIDGDERLIHFDSAYDTFGEAEHALAELRSRAPSSDQ